MSHETLSGTSRRKPGEMRERLRLIEVGETLELPTKYDVRMFVAAARRYGARFTIANCVITRVV